ncbi:hypothetical protein RDWZM_007246 [Blomia tropicalis]|uniref:Uncharacterized protein n=1 Tax=Blomia tropicalis TaxID=40697 RepID=A0A9Q0M9R7_BLOTA|nr:hypothetical protein RDWZM_007246 [Blomia tropicalis]
MMEKSKDSCTFFVKRTNKRNNRVQHEQSSSEDDNESSVVVSSNRRNVHNPMVQSTSSFNKKFRGTKQSTQINNNDSEEEDDDSKNDIHVKYESSRTSEREGPSDMGATMIVETETEKDRDAQSIFERSQLIHKELQDKDPDNVYRGLNNYAQYKTKKDTIQGNAASGHVRKGPIRAPDNIRSTVRWDYQPDICKDYKETGFCGFGDSCKFLHDRSDYKAGWQLELDCQKSKSEIGDDDDDDDDENKYKIEEDDDIPFKCCICRESFKSPVVTKCKHYFCESCALNNYKQSTRCFVCGIQTNGVFNIAKEVIKRLKMQNEES